MTDQNSETNHKKLTFPYRDFSESTCGLADGIP